MIPTRRILAGAAAVACVIVASGCDTSPVAVSVNSQQIKQTALNADIRAYSENQSYVSAFNADQSNQSAGVTIQGSAPGTYSAKFVAGILNDEIVATALHQYLAAHRNLPSPALVAAARGWDAERYGATWLGFPAWFRTQTAQQDAEEAQFVTVSKSTSALQSAVKQASAYLYSQVCVRQVGFSVDGGTGQVSYPASLAAAKRALAQGSPISGGAVNCYTPVQLEAQGSSFYQTIVALGVGKATKPQKTSFGYQVSAVTRRDLLPFDAAMKRATTLVAGQSSGTTASKLEEQIVTSARVHLNPQYGTWDSKTGVTPAAPRTPASAAPASPAPAASAP